MKKVLQESDWSLVSFWNLESLYFTYSHSFSFVFYHSLSLCHSLSLVVICFHSLYHLLSLVVPLLVTRCHSLYHPLSFVETRYKTRCHSISLVVTRCTNRLSYYKQSVIFCEYCEIFKNSFFCRTPLVAAFEASCITENTLASHTSKSGCIYLWSDLFLINWCNDGVNVFCHNFLISFTWILQRF